jgi:hypothetical protein
MNIIYQILEELSKLNQERLFLELKAKMPYLPNEATKLQQLYDEILPLQIELKSLQTKYLVEYEGELLDVYNNNKKYWEKFREVLYFKNDCDVNTFESQINSLDKTPNLSELAMEICDFILHHRFTNYRILNIKKL